MPDEHYAFTPLFTNGSRRTRRLGRHAGHEAPSAEDEVYSIPFMTESGVYNGYVSASNVNKVPAGDEAEVYSTYAPAPNAVVGSVYTGHDAQVGRNKAQCSQHST